MTTTRRGRIAATVRRLVARLKDLEGTRSQRQGTRREELARLEAALRGRDKKAEAKAAGNPGRRQRRVEVPVAPAKRGGKQKPRREE